MASFYPATGSSAVTVWITWNTNSTTNVTDDVFQVWAQGTVSANGWSDWNQHGTGPYGVPQLVVPDPAAQVEERRLAEEKAMALLREHLTRRQRQDLDKLGYFHVQTRKGERVYRIRRDGLPTRVKGEDGQRYSYCIHPAESFPAGDKALAVKLLLESDEERFLEIANASRF